MAVRLRAERIRYRGFSIVQNAHCSSPKALVCQEVETSRRLQGVTGRTGIASETTGR